MKTIMNGSKKRGARMYDHNHYIPMFLLRGFATETPKRKHKIKYVNTKENIVEFRNIFSTFWKSRLYDIPSSPDPKILEKLFGTVIENPVSSIIKRICGANDSHFSISRKELDVLKKYILIQNYRNPTNSYAYGNTINKEKFSFSGLFKSKDETDSDYWKREMRYILEHDWDDIVKQTEMPGVKSAAQSIYQGYLTFFSTDDEFFLSDVPVFTERISITIPKEKEEEFVKTAIEVNKNSGISLAQLEENARREIREKTSYLDNYSFMVLAPKLAVAVVDVIWKMKYLYGDIDFKLESPILENPKNVRIPNNHFVNSDKIIDSNTLQKYKDPNDSYEYEIIKLNRLETDHVMLLSLNETNALIAYKDNQSIIRQIGLYNHLRTSGVPNVKNDYSRTLEAILKYENGELM